VNKIKFVPVLRFTPLNSRKGCCYVFASTGANLQKRRSILMVCKPQKPWFINLIERIARNPIFHRERTISDSRTTSRQNYSNVIFQITLSYFKPGTFKIFAFNTIYKNEFLCYQLIPASRKLPLGKSPVKNIFGKLLIYRFNCLCLQPLYGTANREIVKTGKAFFKTFLFVVFNVVNIFYRNCNG